MKILTGNLTLFSILALVLLLAVPANAQEVKNKKLSIGLNCGTTHSRIKSFLIPGTTEPNLPDKTQKFSLGYYYGISFNYTLKSRWLIAIGINSNLNKLHYTIPEVEFQRSDSVWVDANGDIKNCTYSIAVPLSISYYLNSKPNTPFITIGTILNYYLGTKEKYKIYSDDDGSELSSGNEKYRVGAYKPMNFYISLGGGYKHTLSQKLDLTAMLMYNISTGRVLEKKLNVNVNHRINFMQLGLCLNYKL